MKKIVIAGLMIILGLVIPSISLLQAEEEVLEIPELQIKLPNLVFSDQNKIEKVVKEGQTYYNIPWLAEYLVWLYNYAIGIITVLALLAVMIGGFNWLLAGGSASRVTEAKNWINAAFSGLGLALSSFILLNTINSELVKFPAIQVFSSKKINIEVPALEGGSESDQAYQASTSGGCSDPCVASSNLKYIGDISGVTCVVEKQYCRVTNDTYQKLKTAAALASQSGFKLVVTSALRTCAQQEALWNKYGKNPARVARPSCSNAHLRGTAVDIKLVSYRGEGYTPKYDLYPSGGPYNSGDVAIVTKLKEIMIKSGFTRYCREWWHFQSDTPRQPCYDPVR